MRYAIRKDPIYGKKFFLYLNGRKEGEYSTHVSARMARDRIKAERKYGKAPEKRKERYQKQMLKRGGHPGLFGGLFLNR